jgi:hypothetical protein
MTVRLPFAVRPLLIGEVSSGNERANRPASHLGLLDYMGMTWRTNGTANAWVRGNFPAEQLVDFVAMIAANAGTATTIRVRLGASQAAVDGSSADYDSGALPFISPSISTESELYHSHLELPSAVPCMWWRIDIGGLTSDFEAAGLVMGQKVTPTRFYNKDFEYGIEDLGAVEISPNGIVSETPGYVLRTLQFRLAWLTEAEYQEQFRPMIEALASRGISYWCFDPEPTTYRQAKTYLGYFGPPPFARGAAKPKTFDQEYKIRSLI